MDQVNSEDACEIVKDYSDDSSTHESNPDYTLPDIFPTEMHDISFASKNKLQSRASVTIL